VEPDEDAGIAEQAAVDLIDEEEKNMRRMTALQEGRKEIRQTSTFSGYDRKDIIADGEMYDMKNLTGDNYPSMTPRRKRAYTSFAVGGMSDTLTGIDGRDQLTFVLGTKVYWNFVEVEGLSVSDAADMCPKQIVNFGAYVLIFPDKKYFNTINPEDYGDIDRTFSASGQNVSLTMCRGDGTDYDMTEIIVSDEEPEDPDNGQLWIDQSGDNDVLRQWTDSTLEWVEVATTYVKISAENIGTGLNIYDAIDLSGLEAETTATDRIKAQVSALNGSKIVYYGGTGYIVVVGLISATQSALKSGTTVRADRKMADLDYIVESNNRLWGCRYGSADGQVVNEIHASALGDFRNWNRYMGNSQDSYTASVGTDGPFTGAVTQKGYPVFFKENCIHQVYGNTPSSFQVNTTVCRGIQNGSWRSAVVVNETVYYKSRTDVMMFDGSLPVSVSEALGDAIYYNARAGALGNKYYISMADAEGKWTLFTYDTSRRTWYKEDGFRALGFGKVADELFAICETDNLLWSMTGSVGTIEYDFDWYAVFGIQGIEYIPNKYGKMTRGDAPASRYLSRFDIRMYIEEKTVAKLEIEYDDSGTWESMGEIRGSMTRNFVLPVIPKRCDHLRFRLMGHGSMKIYSISRVMEVGADG